MSRYQQIVVVEALSSGTGLYVVEAALRKAESVIFLTDDRDRYSADKSFDVLHKCEVLNDFPTHDSSAIAEFLRKRIRERGRAPVVLSLVDRVVEAVATACARVDVPFLPVEAVRQAQNKSAFRALCAEIGVPAPHSVDVWSSEDAVRAARGISFPVVVKPARGTGSYGVSACYTPDDVPAAFARAWRDAEPCGVPVQVEEFAVGPLVSAEIVATDDMVHVLGVTGRVLSPYPHFVELSCIFPVGIGGCDGEAIRDSCERLARGLAFSRGPAHVEFALTESGPKVIEFNPRLAGRNVGPMVAAALGWDLYEALVDVAATGGCAVPPAPSRAGAERAIYASRSGMLRAVEGCEIARRVPGVQEIRLTSRIGRTVSATGDQRGEIAITWAVGATSDEARARADAAATALHPVLEPEPDSTTAGN